MTLFSKGGSVGRGAVVEAQAEREETLSCHIGGSSWAELRWCWQGKKKNSKKRNKHSSTGNFNWLKIDNLILEYDCP